MAKKTYNDVPKDEVGDFVQNHIDAGASKISVVTNPDGETCTVTVQT